MQRAEVQALGRDKGGLEELQQSGEKVSNGIDPAGAVVFGRRGVWWCRGGGWCGLGVGCWFLIGGDIDVAGEVGELVGSGGDDEVLGAVVDVVINIVNDRLG